MNLLNIINSQKILHNLQAPIDPDIDIYPGGGWIPGSGGGAISGALVPYLSISPPGKNRSLAIGVTTCFTAEGVISLPDKAYENVNINIGLSQFSNGKWKKTSGSNGVMDDECLNNKLIHKKQSFSVMAKNTTFITPGPPNNNFDISFGIKSTSGYYYYWTIYKYDTGDWFAQCKMRKPDGVIVNLKNLLADLNQTFLIRSDGGRLLWDYTVNNEWVYAVHQLQIPDDVGSFQVFVDGAYLDNEIDEFKIKTGPYQGKVQDDEFIWTTDCPNSIEINGNKLCYTPTISGSCSICVSAPGLDPICINTVSSPPFLYPVGIQCNSCSDDIDCNNIPNPTDPIISAFTIEDTITINWLPSISFTSGLYYELEINGISTDVLDTDVTLINQLDGSYSIKVRAVDDCGQSNWSNIVVVIVNNGGLPIGPANFYLDPSMMRPIEYTAYWDPIGGAIEYEIWIVNAGPPPPLPSKIATTNLTTYYLGILPSGLPLAVRARIGISTYTDFSNIEIVQ